MILCIAKKCCHTGFKGNTGLDKKIRMVGVSKPKVRYGMEDVSLNFSDLGIQMKSGNYPLNVTIVLRLSHKKISILLLMEMMDRS